MKKNFFVIAIAAVCTIGVFSLIFLFSSQIMELYKGALPKSEDFTELYFEDHEQLPRTASPGAELNFNYTVHNLEHANITYPVNVYVQSDANPPETTLVGTSSFSLENNEAKISTSDFVYPESLTLRSKVIVKLMNLDQTIAFWVDIPAQATLSAQEARNPPSPSPSSILRSR
ncbi:hypothetical protein BH10PAT2_BH10PAT2_4140 [soil metagenome]